MNKGQVIADLLRYFWKKQKYWWIPFIIMFLLLGLVILLSESSIVGPFIYSLF
ncbi:MAG: hypothetical protein KDC49_07170 [Saprospiraceae bacterium]|nr:hypothetical protein [Saprospiraceae bacterium]